MCIPSRQQHPKLQDLQPPSQYSWHHLCTQAAAHHCPLHLPNGKVEMSAPTKYTSRTAGPHTPASRVVCGAQITAITKPWYHDLNKEGSEGVGLPRRCFIFVLRTICTAQLVLECIFLAVAGEVPLQLSTASQTRLARGRAFQNVLRSNRKAAECCSSQKSAALVLF